MERGKLYCKTRATDTIYIEWKEVIGVTSQQLLEVELQSGRLIYGSLEQAETQGYTTLRRSTGVMRVPLGEIVRITPIEEDFFSRFDGKLNTGLNATKANGYRQFDLGLELEYVTREFETTLAASSINTESKDSKGSSQSRLNIQNMRKLADRWRTGALVGFERNEELGIDLRSSLGWGAGRWLVQSNSQRLIVMGGLLLTREDVTGSTDNADNIESFGSVNYELFRYHDPDVDLSTGLKVIPGLTDWGRVRSEFSITLSWEIINDLDWQLSFTDTFDSSPPGEGSAKNDYSILTGLSWDL